MKKQIVLPGIAFTETPRPTDAAVDTVDAEERAEGASPQAEAIKETGQADGWPPMADMLHSLFVFEPTTPEPAPIIVLGLGCGCTRSPAARIWLRRLSRGSSGRVSGRRRALRPLWPS